MSTLISTLLAACGHRNCLNKVRQGTQRPLWMRAIQRAMIFLSKRFRFDISVRREYVLLRQFYTHLNVMWRKTKLHAEEQKRIYLAEKAPWILLRRNNSGTSQIPLSAWVSHFCKTLKHSPLFDTPLNLCGITFSSIDNDPMNQFFSSRNRDGCANNEN
ncbi:hypothetical protein GJ496_004403 [Pomphorhynchus laevis]|nr:hypothetical protein GJ496_004403 [Pomphorhynchus laevis]